MDIKYTTGYAGTGKSTALLELSHTVNPETSIIIAPTHKALKRLEDKTPLELRTIHSFLGWVPGINESAEEVGHIDVTIKKQKDIEEIKTVIIDEAGMMSEDMLTNLVAMFELAYDYETEGITLHLFLDPYQLPPVKGVHIQTDPSSTTHLTTQHRAESKDLVDLFTKFVHYLQYGGNDLQLTESENVVYVKNTEGFQKGDRLLGYTNDVVGKFNTAIAKRLGITSYIGQELQFGNLTSTYIVDEIIQPNADALASLYLEGSLFMQDMQVNKKFIYHAMKAMVDHPDISFVSVNGMVIPVVFGIDNAHKARQKAREAAIEDKRKFADVYALNRAFTADYTFASTVHKAQGSEFDRVWIAKNDLLKATRNNNFKLYARLIYVALSRARKKVFIVDV
jgi:exodeoxyribonuclease-5